MSLTSLRLNVFLNYPSLCAYRQAILDAQMKAYCAQAWDRQEKFSFWLKAAKNYKHLTCEDS